MLVYAAEENTRIHYVLEHLLVRQLGINYKITDNLDYFIKSKSTRINYSNEILEGVVNIPCHPLLLENTIKAQKLIVEDSSKWYKLFFKLSYEEIPDFKVDTSYLPFDLLAASFYLLSRYEEYLPNTKDEHNRFKASSSLAFQYQFLDFPLIDHWISVFKQKINKVYPQLTFKTHQFVGINTIDIDFAYKFKGRSKFTLAKKYLGSLIRFKPNNTIWKHAESDAYDTYDYLLNVASKHNVETKFFFLLASGNKLDQNLPPNSLDAIALYQKLAESYQCGIHPSYKASFDSKILEKEWQIFKDITGEYPTISRYHFLKIKVPESFLQLDKLSMEADYTLCYADQIGFRASTCHPFEAFDLTKNQKLNIKLYSPCLMDVTLKNYMKLSAQDALKRVSELKETVRKYHGKFISIWHNSSFDVEEGWQDWDKVYESLFE